MRKADVRFPSAPIEFTNPVHLECSLNRRGALGTARPATSRGFGQQAVDTATGAHDSDRAGQSSSTPESRHDRSRALRRLGGSLVTVSRYTLLLLGTVLLLVTGCSNNYVMRLTNGSNITSANKPKLQGGYYVYKDVRGEKHSVSQARVVEIAPASIAAEEGPKVKKK